VETAFCMMEIATVSSQCIASEIGLLKIGIIFFFFLTGLDNENNSKDVF